MDTTYYLIIPGLGGSGELHWQSWLENTQPYFVRVKQQNWDEPDMDSWVETLNNYVEKYGVDNVVLVAHSLGCLTVAEWFRNYNKSVKAAFLVAPPDIETLQQKLQRRLFQENPFLKLNFPTLVVSSSNDEWSAIEVAQQYADIWGSRFVNIGNAGHINAASGHYEWEQGLELLNELVAVDIHSA
jgi:predicted alpha/beta hydrolase family esterase